MSKIIIALDYTERLKALELVENINPNTCALKVGFEMFTRFGPAFVKELINKQFKVFLDLKFHDIPNTVAKACKSAADLGVWMMNVHASGGSEMMFAAKRALEPYQADAPLLIAVTVLTSMHEKQWSSLNYTTTIQEETLHLAQLAQQAGLDGVVSSARDACAIKILCDDAFLTVTPGIRLPNSPPDDQSRTLTPQEAKAQGSDYLVIGRPITSAANPSAVIQEILNVL